MVVLLFVRFYSKGCNFQWWVVSSKQKAARCPPADISAILVFLSGGREDNGEEVACFPPS